LVVGRVIDFFALLALEKFFASTSGSNALAIGGPAIAAAAAMRTAVAVSVLKRIFLISLPLADPRYGVS
jgi:hypothetical protein